MLAPMDTDIRFLRTCKQGVIQFIVLKPLMAVLSVVMLATGLYDSVVYQTILILIYNVSITWALYAMLLFYLATKPHTVNFQPVKKFFAVKAVVFLTFWQELALKLYPGLTAEETELINDAVICCEMLVIALVCCVAYTYKEFKTGTIDQSFLHNMSHVVSVRDAVQDTYHSFMPAYQDYALTRPYSEAPERKFRAKTFIIGNLEQDKKKDVYGAKHKPVYPKNAHRSKIDLEFDLLASTNEASAATFKQTTLVENSDSD
jgi:hypothetical protein